MAKRIDMTGKKFGRLTVHSYFGCVNNQAMWLCICDCGNESNVLGQSLRKGLSTSCGCYHKELMIEEGKRSKKHGHGYGTMTYKSWQGMHQRCYNKKSKDYKHYGALGVTVCERWHNFECFLEDMGERTKGLTIDRINPFGNYEPSNCRWADYFVQNNNRRSTWKGETHVFA